jgi:hypothetical protein
VRTVEVTEVTEVTEVIDATSAIDVVDLPVAGRPDGARPAAAEARTTPEGTVAALVAPRTPRRARGHGRTPAAAAAGPDVDGPGPAA